MTDLHRGAPIPAAAWSRGIGQPYVDPPRKRIAENEPMIDDGVWGGVPLGGLGAGSIGRTYRGDFARWHLDVGVHRFESLPVNQFSIFVQQGSHSQAHVLSPLRNTKPPDLLRAWNWDMPVGAGTYHALFPKAWYVYDWDVLPLHIVQKQFSPVIPHNYRESSYPVGVFEWRLHNPTDAPLTVGIMFTWQNLLSAFLTRNGCSEGNYNFAVNNGNTGVVLTRPFDKPGAPFEGTFAIAAPQQPRTTLSYRTRFLVSDGEDVWNDFARDGRLDNLNDTSRADDSKPIAAALAATFELAPGETRVVPFALAWDLPIMQFGGGTKWYKRYTRFYGTSGRQAWEIACDALEQFPAWEAAIDAWQQPILDDPARPLWYKTALFNELYYLLDGGTAWENGQANGTAAQPLADPEAAHQETGTGTGHFAVLECYDYPFYNTFDVDFYASFARVLLWPELEKSVIRDFAAAVAYSDTTTVRIQASGQAAIRKAAGAVPHDLGGPPENPWLRVNYYSYQDINIWKDLNSKFVLQVWRDYVLGDRALLSEAWPAVKRALEYLQAFDRDRDGLPDHDNVPDQTYDTWSMSGASAYGGSLWLAALAAAGEMARLQQDEPSALLYAAMLARGQQSFEEKLWTGKYYKYDESNSAHSDSIMADQLVGQWYAGATQLQPIVPDEHVQTTLQTIFDYNVMRFAGGQMGAVNGMRPDGTLDVSSEQSQEVWVGTNYALAAFMLSRELCQQAWQTAWGVFNVTYQRGFWFRTPEAYDVTGNFRASLYLRPLSIWAVEHALQNR